MNLRTLWMLLLAGCSGAGDRLVDQPMADLATVRVPARFEPRPALLNDWFGTSLYLTRPMNSVSAMGSNAPQHENLLVTQMHPVMVHRRGIELLEEVPSVCEYTRDVKWETVAPRGTYQFRYGTGRYTPNTMDKPAVLAQGFDVARGLAVSYRGLEKESDRADVEAMLDSVMASYKATVDLPTYFSEIPRQLTEYVTISLPIELTDPFPWRSDPSGAGWMYFRRHPQWAEDPEIPEQSVAVAVFFNPKSLDLGARASAASILARNADVGTETLKYEQSGTDVTVENVVHTVRGRSEPAWLAYRFDWTTGIGVAYRTWQKNMTSQGAADVVERAIASYRFSGRRYSFEGPPSP